MLIFFWTPVHRYEAGHDRHTQRTQCLGDADALFALSRAGSLSAQRRRHVRTLRNRVKDFILTPEAAAKRKGFQEAYERRGILILDRMKRRGHV